MSARTVEKQEDCLDRFWSFVRSRGVVSETEVQKADVEAYRHYVLGRLGDNRKIPLGACRIDDLLGVVCRYFAWMEKRGAIFRSPATGMEWPKRLYHVLPRVPSELEVVSILAQPNLCSLQGIRDRAILELLYSSGMRLGEVVKLDVYDVDLMARTVRIREGKGGKGRIVPFGETARECLSKYVKEVRPKVQKRRQETALFLAENRGRRVMIGTLRKMLKQMSVKAVGRPVSSHKFRHAFATHMVAGGADIRRVQEMLGHALLSTTQIYTRVSPVALKEVHRRCHPHGKRRQEPVLCAEK